MASALRDQNNLKEAIEACKNALSINPDFHQVYNKMGGIFAKQRNFNKAKNAYQHAIALRSDYFQAYYNLGAIMHNQPEDAIKAYKKVLILIRALGMQNICWLH